MFVMFYMNNDHNIMFYVIITGFFFFQNEKHILYTNPAARPTVRCVLISAKWHTRNRVQAYHQR